MAAGITNLADRTDQCLLHPLHRTDQTTHFGFPFAGDVVRQVAAGDMFQLGDGLIEWAQNDHPQREPGQYRQQHAEQAGDQDQGNLGAGIAFRFIHPLLADLHGKAAEVAEVLFESDAQGRDFGFLDVVIVINLAGLDGVGHRSDALFQIGAVTVLQATGQFTPTFGDGADADKARHFLFRLCKVIIDAPHSGVGYLDLADFTLAHRQGGGRSGA
ncbi:hypothetical protein D3C80_1337800 [compost metagenome]